MKRRLVGPMIMFLMIALAAPASAYNSYGGSFSDDDGDVHEANIEALKSARITDGCGRSTYCPGGSVTRGQMAKFLVRAFGIPSTTTDYFADDDDSIFEADINAMREAGITQGCDDTAYCPERSVTREEMAAFIIRAMAKYRGYAGVTAQRENYFVDDNASQFESFIDEMKNAGVTSGCNPAKNDKYCPRDTVTRAQMATFLTKAAGLPDQKDPTPFGNSTCDAAYSPCVPTVLEAGDLNCTDIRAKYPDGVLNDLRFGDPHGINRDRDAKACEPAGT